MLMPTTDLLDQLSTSQTSPLETLYNASVGPDEIAWVAEQIEYAEFAKTLTCENNAPFVFFVDDGGVGRLVQGCCNAWACPRCGHIRALHEYGRMVNGAKVLADSKTPLFFLTITCRGKEMTTAEAEAGYLIWTNKLMTVCRVAQKRRGLPWAYAAVTERQKRGHPHSHYVTTFCPTDTEPYVTGARLKNGSVARHDGLFSDWLMQAAITAGLGKMVDLSIIRSPVAVAVYTAKYMFKDTAATVWPKGWRRVRYSQSWPKLPVFHAEIAFPLVHLSDWYRMQKLGLTVHADCLLTLESAWARHITCVVGPKVGEAARTAS
jgi:hypothetical protein